MKPIAIIGLGNYLMGDEGAGIHATQALRAMDWPDDVEIIDAGVPSLALIHMIEGRAMAVLIDCADFGGAPGDIRAFSFDDIKHPAPDRQISLHAVDIVAAFHIAIQTGMSLPPIWFVGIQPKHIAMTTDLSAEAQAAIMRVPQSVREIIARHRAKTLH